MPIQGGGKGGFAGAWGKFALSGGNFRQDGVEFAVFFVGLCELIQRL